MSGMWSFGLCVGWKRAALGGICWRRDKSEREKKIKPSENPEFEGVLHMFYKGRQRYIRYAV